jgi:Zn ribbon nucleic-acid-binding protein
MPEPADLDTLIYKLKKRGFHQDDVLLHECPTCKEMGVLIFAITGRSGGRDIRLCVKCGDAKSFRNAAGMETREEDPQFDLRTFLR